MSATRVFAGEKEKGNSVAQEGSENAPAFKILAVRDIGHPALLDYLKSRAIDELIARTQLREVYFTPNSGIGRFFALGCPCGLGFDARSALFKGFVGTGKDISVIVGTGENNQKPREVAVFEGFMDYLSLLTHRRISASGKVGTGFPTRSTTSKEIALKEDVIILHSIALKRRAASAIKAGKYSQVSLYLDHDAAGRAATRFFIAETGRDNTTDASGLNDGYKDLNEWLIERERKEGR